MVREYIKRIADNKKTEDMAKLGDILCEALYKLKDYDVAYYDDIKNELYVMAYGYSLTDGVAEKIVAEMTPYHVHWTKEQTTQVMRSYGLNYNENEFFVVMNMAYNDYHELFGEDVDKYVQFSKMFMDDPDAKPHKVFRYFMV